MRWLIGLTILVALLPAPLRSEDPPTTTDDDRWELMDCGPTFSTTLHALGRKPIIKGIVVRLGENQDKAVVFDTELLSMALGWVGEPQPGIGAVVDMPTRKDGFGGSVLLRGRPVFDAKSHPGWAQDGEFEDPREIGYGPLPDEWGQYRGLYLHGGRVVFSYTIGDCSVLDSPGLEQAGATIAFSRSLEIGPHDQPHQLLLGDGPRAEHRQIDRDSYEFRRGDVRTRIELVAAPEGVQWRKVQGSAVALVLPPARETTFVKVLTWSGAAGEAPQFELLAGQSDPAVDLISATLGGPPLWPEALQTSGQVSDDAGPYVVDTIAAPQDDPWNAFLRFAGFDFFENGDAAICSVSGDVWIVSGIDEDLDRLSWRRFATGLYHPLGLKIVGGKVHVLGRDQITRLHDINNDGEADYYECFNNDCVSVGFNHGFHACLETDADGNFYYVTCSSNGKSPHGGSVIKVSADGKELSVIATGFRNPNGMGVGPNGEILVADQQGTWVPSSKIDRVRPGGFYGYMPSHHREKEPGDFDPPLCWIPHRIDNSCGGQVWTPDDRWGLPAGTPLHLSYGKCEMFAVLTQTVALVYAENAAPGGQAQFSAAPTAADNRQNSGRKFSQSPAGAPSVAQGGVVKLPVVFDSGVMRARFSPHDGALYACGLRGWQTAAANYAAFQRVRYTGAPHHLPIGLRADEDGIAITFNRPLDPESAADYGNYYVEVWNYRWTEEYGSKDYLVSNRRREGHDELEIYDVRLLDDRTVYLEIDGLAPVMQMEIGMRIQAADGTPIEQSIFNTIHALPANN